MCDVALSLTPPSGSETDMKSWEKTRDPAVPTDWHGSERRIMRSASLHNQISGFWSVSQSVRPTVQSTRVLLFPFLLLLLLHQLTSHYLTFFHALFPLSMQSTISMTFIQKSRQNSDRPTDRVTVRRRPAPLALLRFSPQINVDFCIFIPREWSRFPAA